MIKRFVCMFLSLVLLLGMVPMAAMTASAAAGSVSEKAITVLKELEEYSQECEYRNGYYGKGFYIGYGTKCTHSDHNDETSSEYSNVHKIREYDADEALREALKELSKTVAGYFPSLNQHQHDALVLVSFQNGTAWMNGADDLRSAVVNGLTGNEFLNVICNWKSPDAVELNRRKVEANMYLNNQYDCDAPSRFVHITYNTNGGELETSKKAFYYDVELAESKALTPTKKDNTFLGWYKNGKQRITSLSSLAGSGSTTLVALWQPKNATAASMVTAAQTSPMAMSYRVAKSGLVSTTIYDAVNGKNIQGRVGGSSTVVAEFIDAKGVRWAKITTSDRLYKYLGNNKFEDTATGTYDSSKSYWVKLGTPSGDSGSNSGSAGYIKVTVTNSYVNRRAKASIFGTKNGTYYQGDVLRITSVKDDGSYLWGAVLGEDYTTIVGYVALMYTDYDQVKAQESQKEEDVDTSIAKAVVWVDANNVNSYVNVRSGAGTGNAITGSLRHNTQVDLYEVKYVNGQQWGRCNVGWFCLSYAKVTGLTTGDIELNDAGYLNYVFEGTAEAEFDTYAGYNLNATKQDKIKKNDKVQMTNLTLNSSGTTSARFYVNGKDKGWALFSDANGVLNGNIKFDTIKFEAIADATVRENPENGAARKDVLVKGVELRVEKIVADKTTIWGTSDKLVTQYGDPSWVNLSTRYFSRVNPPINKIEDDSANKIYELATVIDTQSVNVRTKANIFATKSGSLVNGTTVRVLEGPVNGNATTGWYRLDIDVDGNENTQSWVSGKYLKIFKGKLNQTTGAPTTSPDGTQAATGRGIVANTYGGVAVRTAPGTANALITRLLPGTLVNILEVQNYGTTQWGRIDDGQWVCMDYIAMVDYDELPGNTTTTTEKAIYSGKVNTDTKVYSKADETSDEVRTLSRGTQVTVHELVEVKEYIEKDTGTNNESQTVETVTTYWARINDGYIKAPGNVLDMDALDEEIYTVTGTDKLNVRDQAGTSGNIDFRILKGAQVAVTRIQIVYGSFWGFVEYDDVEGWVSMAYLTKGAIETPAEGEGDASNPSTPAAPVVGSTGNTGVGNYSGRIIGAEEVNVREKPDNKSAEVTKLKKGTAITITETRLENGRSWGYCGSGWVNLVYVDLAPIGITAIDAKVIANDNTLIYKDNAGTEVVGTYVNRAVVNIYEDMGGMYKTDLGWISKDNCL